MTFNVPEQPAPIVNNYVEPATAPDVLVDAPVVNVTTPDITVDPPDGQRDHARRDRGPAERPGRRPRAQARSRSSKTVERDDKGRITGVTETDGD